MRTLDAQTARGNHRATAIEVTPIDAANRCFKSGHPEGPLLQSGAPACSDASCSERPDHACAPESAMILHEDIISALPEDFVRIMRNWVRSTDGSAIGTSVYDFIASGRYEAKIPVLMGEAQDTQRAIYKLPQRHQEVITIFWTEHDLTLAEMARATPRVRLWQLGPASFKAWLAIAHDRLQKELKAQREAARELAAQAQTAVGKARP
jgi:hypothetical protein